VKTVFVSFYETFPPVSGAATVTYNVAKYLSGEKYLIQLGSDKKSRVLEGDINLINIRYISDNHFIKIINLSVQFPNIIAKLKQLNPEIIILEGASWALYYLFLFYLIKINRMKSKIIYHAHNVEYLLREKKNNRVIALITKWAEGIMMTKADLSTAVSKDDALNFERIYGIIPIILPNGVDVGNFDNINERQIRNIKAKYNLKEKIVLFMGLASFMPNREGVNFLINDVFPMIIREWPEVRLAVIGGSVKYKKKWLLNPGCIPFKEVPIFIKACDVCVAPIFSGSGTRLKILEYMAASKPVVSTTKGAEGISVKNGENIIIANSANRFAEKIIFLLRNPGYAEKIGYEGMKMVRANYSWQKIMEDFNRELLRLFDPLPIV